MRWTLAVILLMGFSFGCKKVADDGTAPGAADWTILGTWKSRTKCIYMGPNTYVNSTVSYEESKNFSQIVDVFSDSTCMTYVYRKEIAGTYELSESSKSSSAVSGYLNIDSILTLYDISPVSVAAATRLNTSNFCGFNNWVYGATKSVLGRTCSGSAMPTYGSIEYSILQKYFQDYSVIYPPDMQLKPPDEYYYGGDLMFGTPSNDKDGKTASRRHDTIQNNFAHIRQ